MVEKLTHPAARWKLVMFERCPEYSDGKKFAGQFVGHPLIWTGNNKEKIIAEMERFRFETIVKYENINRQRKKKRKEVIEGADVDMGEFEENDDE